MAKNKVVYSGGYQGYFEAVDPKLPGKFIIEYVGARMWQVEQFVKGQSVSVEFISDDEMPDGECGGIWVFTEINGKKMWAMFSNLNKTYGLAIPTRPQTWWGELNGGYAAAEEWRGMFEDAYYDQMADIQPEQPVAQNDDYSLLEALCAKLGLTLYLDLVKPQAETVVVDYNDMRAELGLIDQPKQNGQKSQNNQQANRKLTKRERRALRQQTA